MNIKEIDFKPILEKARNKDEESIRELVECTKGYVGFVARSITGSKEAAQDVSQEYYIKLFQNINNINEQSFLAWTNTVIRNCSYDYLRKNNKLNEYGEKASFVNYDDAVYIAEDEKIENQPDKVFEQQERQRFILEIIDSLPLEQREVIVAYFYQEKKIKDIAKELNISENTVKSRLAYAKKHIAIKVEELHKKYDIKLYNVAPIGFFIGLLVSSRHSHSLTITELMSSTPKTSISTNSEINLKDVEIGRKTKTNINPEENDDAPELPTETDSDDANPVEPSEDLDPDNPEPSVEPDSDVSDPSVEPDLDNPNPSEPKDDSEADDSDPSEDLDQDNPEPSEPSEDLDPDNPEPADDTDADELDSPEDLDEDVSDPSEDLDSDNPEPADDTDADEPDSPEDSDEDVSDPSEDLDPDNPEPSKPSNPDNPNPSDPIIEPDADITTPSDNPVGPSPDNPIPSEPIVTPGFDNPEPVNPPVSPEPSVEPEVDVFEDPDVSEPLIDEETHMRHKRRGHMAARGAKAAGRHVGRRIFITLLVVGTIGGGGFYAYKTGLLAKIPFISQFFEKKSLVCKLPIDDPRMDGLTLEVYTKNSNITKAKYLLVGENDVGSSGTALVNGILSGASNLLPGIEISSKELPNNMMQISAEIDVNKVTDLSMSALEMLGVFSQDDINEIKETMKNIHAIKETHEGMGFDCHYLD